MSKEENNSEKIDTKNLLISKLNDPKRQIGNTNYQKFEQIAKMIEKNEKIEKEEKDYIEKKIEEMKNKFQKKIYN